MKLNEFRLGLLHVCDMWRNELGLLVLQVAHGDF